MRVDALYKSTYTLLYFTTTVYFPWSRHPLSDNNKIVIPLIGAVALDLPSIGHYQVLGQELIPAYRQSTRRWLFKYSPSSRLALLFARPAVTFASEERHRPSTSTKLYCLVSEAHRCLGLLCSFVLVFDMGIGRYQVLGQELIPSVQAVNLQMTF